jgi:hypothetical protein
MVPWSKGFGVIGVLGESRLPAVATKDRFPSDCQPFQSIEVKKPNVNKTLVSCGSYEALTLERVKGIEPITGFHLRA